MRDIVESFVLIPPHMHRDDGRYDEDPVVVETALRSAEDLAARKDGHLTGPMRYVGPAEEVLLEDGSVHKGCVAKFQVEMEFPERHEHATEG